MSHFSTIAPYYRPLLHCIPNKREEKYIFVPFNPFSFWALGSLRDECSGHGQLNWLTHPACHHPKMPEGKACLDGVLNKKGSQQGDLFIYLTVEEVNICSSHSVTRTGWHKLFPAGRGTYLHPHAVRGGQVVSIVEHNVCVVWHSAAIIWNMGYAVVS